MLSNSESHSSLNSISMPLSVKSQTKDKFDALLRNAIQKKKSRRNVSVSKENLLNDLESNTASSDNLFDKSKFDEVIELKELKTQSNENEITLVEIQNDVKAPIPKPRKKKCVSPTLSQATFEVTSPKIVRNQSNNYVESPSSNKTYNVEEAGDVLIHSSPLRPKIIVKNKTRSKKLGKGDIEIESDNESKTSESDDEDKEMSKDDKIEEVVKVEESPEDTVEYVNENAKQKEKQAAILDEDLKKRTYTYEKIIEIIVHKTDRLQLSSLVVHPVVKIHVVDATTGKYFPKSDKSRPVVFFYENSDNDYISPVMTNTYNLQEKRILYPSWEESILLNEDYKYLMDKGNHIMLFFEVLDFVSFATLQQRQEKDCAKGWHYIAFAFLKISGKHGALNVGKKIRLQLYYSYRSKKNNPQICNAWRWWKKKKLKQYPSTLYVTIKSTISPTKIVETFRSKTPIQRETSSKTKLCDNISNDPIPDSTGSLLTNKISDSDLKRESFAWTRKPNEICKLPNKCLVKFESYDQGCFVMEFSHSGLHLACAVQIENLFYVVVYSIVSLREVNKFSSHQALIYSIKWSSDDSYLLSASADNTISVFRLTSCSLFQILPHPSFVYSCDISHDKTIASGCYDGIIRIWNHAESDSTNEFNLHQELEAHAGYVTSLCFSKKSNIFSADSTGVIAEWEKENDDWILKRKINLLDLKETIINQIILFPKERKLLVQSRDSTIRIIDLKSGCVLQWLRGGLNKRFQIFCSISPCGTYVYSGSENGFVHVWNSKNGHEIATYVPYSSEHQFLTIHCVEFHPHDNILAISHYGKKVPILLYCLDQDMQQPAVNLTIKEEYNVDNIFTRNVKPEPKLKEIVRRNHSIMKREEKLDFKGVLQKMDLVISSQKN